MSFFCIIQQYLVRVCVCVFFTMFGSTTAKQPIRRILMEVVVVVVVLSDRLPPKRFTYCCQWKPRSSSRGCFVWSISAAFSAWYTTQAQDELCVPHHPPDYPSSDNWLTPPSHLAVARHLGRRLVVAIITTTRPPPWVLVRFSICSPLPPPSPSLSATTYDARKLVNTAAVGLFFCLSI